MLGTSLAAADPLIDGLATDDPKATSAAVAAIEHAPASTPDLADALFAAAKVCEDTLADPARALALYERIGREQPDSRVAMAAGRRAEALREQIGIGGAHTAEAQALAKLVAEANELEVDEIVRRADTLAATDWPGAPEAALWLADWLRRDSRFDEAQARYAVVTTRWPNTPHAVLALRGGAGCALEAADWERAEALARKLPSTEISDAILRDDLLASAKRGRRFGRLYTLAWAVVVLGFAAIAGSLVEAARRGGWRRPNLVPPIEVAYIVPVAAVLVGVALTTHQLIAPAVLTLTIGGLVLAWISGAALDLLRARGRDVRNRALLHAIVISVAVIGLAYIALMRDNLLDMVIETIATGPEP
ncbi:MAG: tetratricopeptide repeat protein [Kofleriaceae bacterium]